MTSTRKVPTAVSGFSTTSQATAASVTMREEESLLKVTTFNLLAPLYFIVPSGEREKAKTEADSPEFYTKRHKFIGEFLSSLSSDIFCLQEVWLPNESNAKNKEGVLHILEEKLGNEYDLSVFHQRSGTREDGLMILFKKSRFILKGFKGINLQSFRKKHRIALIAHLQTKPTNGETLNVIVATTHFLFPNKATDFMGHNHHIADLRSAMNEFIQKQGVVDNNICIINGDFNAGLNRKTLKKKGILSGKFAAMAKKMMSTNWLTQLFDEEGYQLTQDTSSSNYCSHMPHTHKPIDCDFIFYKSNMKIRPRSIAPSMSSLETAYGSDSAAEDGEFYVLDPNPGARLSIASRKQLHRSTTIIQEVDVSDTNEPSKEHQSLKSAMKASTKSKKSLILKKKSSRQYKHMSGKSRNQDNLFATDYKFAAIEQSCETEFDLLPSSQIEPSGTLQVKEVVESDRKDSSLKKKSSGFELSAVKVQPASQDLVQFLNVHEEKCELEMDVKMNFPSPKKKVSARHPNPVSARKGRSLRLKAKLSFRSNRSKRSNRSRRTKTVRSKKLKNAEIAEIMVDECYLEPKHFRGTIHIARPVSSQISELVFGMLLSKENIKQKAVRENPSARFDPSGSIRKPTGMKKLLSRRKKEHAHQIPSLDNVDAMFVKEWAKISDHRPKTAIFFIPSRT